MLASLTPQFVTSTHKDAVSYVNSLFIFPLELKGGTGLGLYYAPPCKILLQAHV
jgi:hypothetical protein